MPDPSDADEFDATAEQRAADVELASRSAFYYLDRVLIPCPPAPRPFGAVADPWQLEVVAPKAAAVDGLCGLAPYTGPWSFLTILPRGHDKSSLEARFANFCLRFSRRRIDGYLCAADKDQAKLILEAMRVEADLNPHMFGDLVIDTYKATGPGGRIQALASDYGSAAGLRGNLYICDEITHWKSDALWNMIVTGREKVQPALLVAITNAGFLGTWQDRVRAAAYASPDWRVFEREGKLCSWMSDERVNALRALLSPQEAARLFDNVWLDLAAEMDYLDRGMISLCLDPNWRGHERKDGRSRYVVVVDYGATKDRCALLVCHQDDEATVRPDRFDVWQGSREVRVQVSDVDAWVDEMIDRYDPAAVVFDEHQMEASIQRQEKRACNQGRDRIRRFRYRGGMGNLEIAQDLRAAVLTRKLRWHPDQGAITTAKGILSTVVDELASLVTRKMPYGYRFDHTAQQHDDRAVVLGMGITEALKLPPRPNVQKNVPVAPPLAQDSPHFGRNPWLLRG